MSQDVSLAIKEMAVIAHSSLWFYFKLDQIFINKRIRLISFYYKQDRRNAISLKIVYKSLTVFRVLLELLSSVLTHLELNVEFT